MCVFFLLLSHWVSLHLRTWSPVTSWWSRTAPLRSWISAWPEQLALTSWWLHTWWPDTTEPQRSSWAWSTRRTVSWAEHVRWHWAAFSLISFVKALGQYWCVYILYILYFKELLFKHTVTVVTELCHVAARGRQHTNELCFFVLLSKQCCSSLFSYLLLLLLSSFCRHYPRNLIYNNHKNTQFSLQNEFWMQYAEQQLRTHTKIPGTDQLWSQHLVMVAIEMMSRLNVLNLVINQIGGGLCQTLIRALCYKLFLTAPRRRRAVIRAEEELAVCHIIMLWSRVVSGSSAQHTNSLGTWERERVTAV